MLWIFFAQPCKHLIHRILVILVIFSGIHGIDHVNHGCEVLFMLRCFIADITDERTIEQGFSLYPEIIAGFSFAFSVCDQRCDQLQYVLFCPDIGERVIMHAFLEIDCVEHFDSVVSLLQQFSALNKDASFRVGYHIGRMQLHEIGLQPEAGFT